MLVRFTSKATGIEVIHHHGYLYILSDLFLLCEEMAREERVARGEDGKDMRLCYPPLSGKVVNVTEVPGQGLLCNSSRYSSLIPFIENVLQVSIMRKETLIMEAGSRLQRDRILNEFQECISFAKTSKSHHVLSLDGQLFSTLCQSPESRKSLYRPCLLLILFLNHQPRSPERLEVP